MLYGCVVIFVGCENGSNDLLGGKLSYIGMELLLFFPWKCIYKFKVADLSPIHCHRWYQAGSKYWCFTRIWRKMDFSGEKIYNPEIFRALASDFHLALTFGVTPGPLQQLLRPLAAESFVTWRDRSKSR